MFTKRIVAFVVGVAAAGGISVGLGALALTSLHSTDSGFPYDGPAGPSSGAGAANPQSGFPYD